MASLDDVFNLLTAVNQTTLGRMEGEIKDTKSLLDAVNGTTLGRMEGEMVQPHSMVDKSVFSPTGLRYCHGTWWIIRSAS